MSEGTGDLAEKLQAEKSVILSTRGRSMQPLIYEGKTKVLIEPLKDKPQKGDLLLWLRKDGTYVLHRMVGEDEKHYLLLGDNCIHVNHANKKRVIGIATSICRNGKWFSVTDRRYMMYVRIWTALFPFRKFLYWILKEQYHENFD